MTELHILLTTAMSLAFIHTLIGVDHYLPFVVLSRANNWSTKKTMLIVFSCGTGHVLSSVILGLVGITLAAGISLMVGIQEIRGDVATYFLIAFGLIYTIYGIRQSFKTKPHSHATLDGAGITHTHSENGENHKPGEQEAKRTTNIFWGLFILFVLGPCEPLIPVLMYPAATHDTFTLISVITLFAVCTIATMLLITFLGIKSIRLLKLDKLERYSQVIAGSTLLLCGIGLLLLH